MKRRRKPKKKTAKLGPEWDCPPWITPAKLPEPDSEGRYTVFVELHPDPKHWKPRASFILSQAD